jgi:hypothetical protein
VKKIFQLLALVPRLVGNIHKVNTAVEKGYSAWQGVYEFLKHMAPEPAPVLEDAGYQQPDAPAPTYDTSLSQPAPAPVAQPVVTL